mmetsp:Transcript_49834/g.128215  ORF Transcript_49834/g.128215 Transcript_49834/m.128215 type:complete len:279 (-) Transcript_49834:375-1211(-)
MSFSSYSTGASFKFTPAAISIDSSITYLRTLSNSGSPPPSFCSLLPPSMSTVLLHISSSMVIALPMVGRLLASLSQHSWARVEREGGTSSHPAKSDAMCGRRSSFDIAFVRACLEKVCSSTVCICTSSVKQSENGTLPVAISLIVTPKLYMSVARDGSAPFNISGAIVTSVPTTRLYRVPSSPLEDPFRSLSAAFPPSTSFTSPASPKSDMRRWNLSSSSRLDDFKSLCTTLACSCRYRTPYANCKIRWRRAFQGSVFLSSWRREARLPRDISGKTQK